jgi:hypothetical protein
MIFTKPEKFVVRIIRYFYFFGRTSALRSLQIAPTRPVIGKDMLSVHVLNFPSLMLQSRVESPRRVSPPPPKKKDRSFK